MCAGHEHDTPQGNQGLRGFITNWNQPMPLRTKLRKLARNVWIRVATRSNCCGHTGEPGC